jgi:hypothetical protein
MEDWTGACKERWGMDGQRGQAGDVLCALLSNCPGTALHLVWERRIFHS